MIRFHLVHPNVMHEDLSQEFGRKVAVDGVVIRWDQSHGITPFNSLPVPP